MLKRAAGFVLFCGLGVGLALLVRWVVDRGGDGFHGAPPDVARTPADAGVSAAPSPRALAPAAAARPGAEEPAPDGAIRVDESAAAPPSATPIAVPFGAPPRGSETTAAPARTPAERAPPADAEAPPGDDDRPAAWCFFTSLGHRFLSDTDNVFSGSRSAVIEGPLNHPQLRVNAIVQGIDATPYRGSRVELSVYAETGGETRLFLQAVTQRELALASNGAASAAPAEKTFVATGAGWTRVALVTEVPSDAAALYFGFGNFGTAKLRLDAAELEKVGADTPLTEVFGKRAPLFISGSHVPVYAAPANLDFEITAGAAGEAPSC